MSFSSPISPTSIRSERERNVLCVCETVMRQWQLLTQEADVVASSDGWQGGWGAGGGGYGGVSVVSCRLLQHQRQRLAKVVFVRVMFKKQPLDATSHVTHKSNAEEGVVGVGQFGAFVEMQIFVSRKKYQKVCGGVTKMQRRKPKAARFV